MTDNEFLLSRYIDGDLDEAERARLETELETDPELRRTLERMRRVDQLARDWGTPVPTVDAEWFVARARQRCEAYERSRRIVRVYRLFAPIAAAAVIALVVTGYLLVDSFAPGRSAPATPVAIVSVGPAAGAGTTGADRRPVAVVSFSRAAAPFAESQTHAPSALLVAAVGGSEPPGRGEDDMPFF